MVKKTEKSFKSPSDITVNTDGKRNMSEPSEFTFLYEKNEIMI